MPKELDVFLDARRSKLFPFSAQSLSLMKTVDAVLADIAAIWPSV
jgi:hypothetical protein